MMAIVVHHAHPGALSFELKATLDAAKLRQRFIDLGRGNVQTDASGNCCSRIEHVVMTWHLKSKVGDLPATMCNFESAAGSAVCGVASAFQYASTEIRCFSRAISNDSPFQPRKKPEKSIVVHTSDHSTIEWYAVHEVYECLFHVFHVAITVHVLAIDIGDDGENRR